MDLHRNKTGIDRLFSKPCMITFSSQMACGFYAHPSAARIPDRPEPIAVGLAYK